MSEPKNHSKSLAKSPAKAPAKAPYEAVHEEACRRGQETYIDPETGYVVFTRLKLLANGECCNSGCRHCPYPSTLN